MLKYTANENAMSLFVSGVTAEGKKATEITVPSEHAKLRVTKIDSFAFAYRGKLSKVDISEGVMHINPNAFSECKSLLSVKLPETLKTLGAEAFSFCKNLREIYIPDGVTQILKGTFFSCAALELAVLGDGVISIGKDAFWCCKKLKTVSLPVSVKHIEKGAFYECVSLSDVYYGGDEDDWRRIKIEGSNERLFGAKIHFLSKYRAADFDESYNTKDV